MATESKTAKQEEWLKLNTCFCNRFSSWISLRACEVNREETQGRYGDNRCVGCGGLYQQDLQSDAGLARSLAIALGGFVGAEPSPEEPSCEYNASDDIQHELLDDEDLDEFLESLFPIPVIAPPPREPQKTKPVAINCRPRRVAVYVGRCRKCGGYMINSLERQFDQRDDEVYRCFSCSWRTSPMYSWNRNNL